MGYIRGLAGGEEPPWLIRENFVWADLVVFTGDSALYLVLKTDGGPFHVPLPTELEQFPRIALSSVNNSATGMLLANQLIEEALIKMLAEDPIELIQVDGIEIPLWRCTLKGIGCQQDFLVGLPSFPNAFYKAQCIRELFDFHKRAVGQVVRDLTGKMTTSLTK